MTQYFYVDESGDPGLHSLNRSPYYVVAMAQLPNREPIDELATLRRELHLAPKFEFHYYHMSSEQKRRFFLAIQPLLFRIRAAALVKSSIPLGLQKLNAAEFTIELLARLTLRASPLDIGNDILVLDNATDSFLKSLRVHFSRVCKSEKRVRPFKKIVSSDSRHDDGLQLADMIAGAIRQHIWEHDSAYFRMFSKKVVDLWRIA